MESTTPPAGGPQLLARVVVIGTDGRTTVTPLVSEGDPDVGTVHQLARQALAVRRAHGRLLLEDPSPFLAGLLGLTGLLGLLEPVGSRHLDDGPDDSARSPSSSLATGGAPMSEPNPTAQITRLHTVGVPVADQDRALGFYVERLGFRSVRDVPLGPGRRWVEVAPPEGTTTVALVAGDAARPGIDTGIRMVSADVERDHAALRAAGVDVDEILHWEGAPPMFALRDLDGNRLELVEGD